MPSILSLTPVAMTQNIQKFFGFRVALDDDLTPIEEGTLRLIAEKLVAIHRLDTNRYFVYFHHLKIMAQPTHFGYKGSIEDRVDWIVLDFEVNKKQIKSGALQFFNSLIEGHLLPEYEHRDVRPSFSDYGVSFQIPGSYFHSVNYFRSAIITFVDRDKIRPDRRKIKATVTVVPSLDYANRIRSDRRVPHTKLDVRFTKDIQLRLPLGQTEEAMTQDGNDAKNTGPRDVYNFHIQQAGAVGTNSRAEHFEQKLTQDPVSKELITLLTAIAREPSRTEDIELVRQAVSAKNEDEAKSYLSKTSKWVLSTAEKIGVSLAAQLIKDSIG